MVKWRNQVEIKQYLSDDTSDESVLKITSKIIPQLNYIIRQETRTLDKIKDEIKQDNLEHMIFELEGLLEEFKWIKEGIETGEDISEIYDSWCYGFNEFLSQLYDLGDTCTEYKDYFNKEKFMWVG